MRNFYYVYLLWNILLTSIDDVKIRLDGWPKSSGIRLRLRHIQSFLKTKITLKLPQICLGLFFSISEISLECVKVANGVINCSLAVSYSSTIKDRGSSYPLTSLERTVRTRGYFR